MFEMTKRRLSEKLRSLQNTIAQNIMDFIFTKDRASIRRRLDLIQSYFEPGLAKLREDDEILEHVCKEVTDVKKMQE